MRAHYKTAEGLDVMYHYGEIPNAVCIIPVNKDGKIGFVKQYRVLFDEFTWELPAGGLEDGQSPLEMAQLELQQEMRVGSKDLVEIGGVQTANARLTELMYVFIASELTDEAQEADENEEFERVWLDLKEVRRMVLAGEIVDGITLYALYLYELHMKTL